MNLTIPDKNDKDAQIKYLKEVLAEVKNEVSSLYTSRCENCCDYFYSDVKEVNGRVKSIVGFIDKRLNDVTY